MSTRKTVYDQSHGRVPIIALDYSQRYLRRCKELMIDYTNGNLYVVDANDRNIIYNIVSQIIDQVKTDIDSDDITVVIDGVGKINLTQFLIDLKEKTLCVEVLDAGANVPLFKIDNKSLEVVDDTIQICNFDNAIDGYTPYKNGEFIDWKSPGISPSSPVKEPDKDESSQEGSAITLGAWTINKSSNLPDTVNVTIDNTELASDYGTIVWNVAVTDTIPTINFPNNVKFTFNTDPTLFENCIATFRLETYTAGSIWLCTVEKYLNISEQEITESYIIDKFSWKSIGG